MWDKLSVFFGDDADLLNDVRSSATAKSHEPGARIFGEGDESDTVYCVLEGRTRAIRYSENGTEVWLDQFEEGDIFGEMASLSENIRTADMYALSDTTVAAIPSKAFIRLIEGNGSVGLKVCRLLAARIQNTTRTVFEQATLSAKARVYADLLRMAKSGDGNMPVIKNMLTVSDFAKKLAIARETVSRAMSKLREQGILETRGEDLLILRPQELVSRLNQ